MSLDRWPDAASSLRHIQTSCSECQNPECFRKSHRERHFPVILTTLWKPSFVPASENEKIQYRSVYSHLYMQRCLWFTSNRRYEQNWKICFSKTGGCCGPQITLRANKVDLFPSIGEIKQLIFIHTFDIFSQFQFHYRPFLDLRRSKSQINHFYNVYLSNRAGGTNYSKFSLYYNWRQ